MNKLLSKINIVNLSKNNFVRVSFIIIVSISMCFALWGVFSVFINGESSLIRKREYSEILNCVKNYAGENSIINLIDIDGDKDVLVLRFADVSKNGGESNYNVIYDIKGNRVVSDINSANEDYSLDVLSSPVAEYIGDGNILIVDESGVISIANIKKKDYTISVFDDIDISRRNVYDYTFYNNSLYVLTREYYGQYREVNLSNNTIYKITLNDKLSKVDVSSRDLLDDEFAISFVSIDDSLGVLCMDSISVPMELVDVLKKTSDVQFLQKIPCVDGEYKFLNPETAYVIDLISNESVDIPSSVFERHTENIHEALSARLGVDLWIPINLPFAMFGDSFAYGKISLIDKLLDAPVNPLYELVLNTDTIGMVSGTSTYLDEGKYPLVVGCEDGLVGVSSKGKFKGISKYRYSYPSKKGYIFYNDGIVKYHK